MSSTEQDGRSAPAAIAGLYREFAPELRAFLLGLLRDHHLAEEALQATFVKALSKGHTIEASQPRGWLFQVAYREAMQLRRRQGVESRGLSELKHLFSRSASSPDSDLIRAEELQRISTCLQSLPPEQQQVVHRRIVGEQTFAEIAAELNVPLGTVLTRMRLALQKLQKSLADQE